MTALRTIRTSTVSAGTMHDIELSGGNPLDLSTWFLSNSADLEDLGYGATLSYPFIQFTPTDSISTSVSATAPFGRFSFIPIYGSDIANFCITIEDPSANTNTTICEEVTGNTYGPRDPGVQRETLILSDDLTGQNSSKIHTLVIKGNQYIDYNIADIVWQDVNSPTWRIYNSTLTDPMTGVSYSYTVTGNQLQAHFDFDATGSSTYDEKIEIYAYTIPQQYPELIVDNQDSNITNVAGIGTGKQVVFTADLSSVGISSNLLLSASNTILNYEIAAIFNETGANKITYNDIGIGVQTPIVSGEVVGSTYQLFVSGDVTWDYYGYVMTPESLNNSFPIRYDVSNVTQDTDISIDNAAYNNTQNIYGSQWISFIDNPTTNDVELSKHIAVWNNANDEVSYNSMQSERLNSEDSNAVIDRLSNGGVGVSLDSGSGYWNAQGFRTDYHANKVVDVVRWSNDIVDNSSDLVDSYTVGDAGGAVWDININEVYTSKQYKKRIYTLWQDASAFTTSRDILATDPSYNNEMLPTVTLDASTLSLYISGNDTVYIDGTRTLTSNASSFTATGTSLLDSSSYDDNMWTVYCSSSDVSFLAAINSNKTNSNSDFLVSTGPLTGVEFTVVDSGPTYDLTLTSSQTWNVSGYRIDSRDLEENATNISTPTTIFSNSTIGTPEIHSNTRWYKNALASDESIYSTQLIDNMWENFSASSKTGYDHITNINTSTDSLCAYGTLAAATINASKTATASNVIFAPQSRTWNVSSFDYSAALAQISTPIYRLIDRGEPYTVDYIFSHPGDYTAIVAITGTDGSTDSQTFTDKFSVDEIAPTASIHYTSSAVNTITDQFTATPGVSSLSYYDTDIALGSVNTNTIYFNTLLTEPGSFPIGEILFDFGDGSGISKVTRNGISSTSLRTTIDTVDLFDSDLTSSTDPRRYSFYHTFPSDQNVFNVSMSAMSVDTRALSTSTISISGFTGLTSIVKRLVKSVGTDKGEMVYSILADEGETI